MSAEPVTAVTTAAEAKPVAEEPKPVTSEALEPVVEESKPATSEVVPAPTETAKAETSEAVPETKPTADETKPAVEATPAASPLSNLFAELPSIIKDAEHNEIWGIELADESHVPTTIVLEKFLRANTKDVAKAKAQLIEALKWRKTINPMKLLADEEFDTSKFGGLGYVTLYPKAEGHGKEIVTWNIYGAVKDNKATFGDVEEFVKWRAALMELSLKELDLSSATEKIPENGEDPYRMVQVHDYLNVSFLRMDPTIRAASKQTIQTFSMAYPELLKEKFFVNVPLVMGWVFTAMKVFLSPETVKKFHPLSYGSSLAGELPSFGKELPTVYGGKGKDIEEGLTVKYGA
ncbi:Phosphatidylinositol transfer protein [Lachnellula hyalina]|uniref:Phosphatidylinositol transfer protein SFH5 n=1 Tax=Lachnellula hyalina TaxID=1316788 RepID=A0A8H8QTD9_9HELO|nr:Phosphatidylinositol transfer protein [Lachnellula hyalina]TVY22201.1 Phosphatidylinositol transfer protein [Lachnellula hyalina]